MTKLDQLIEQNPELEVYPAITISIDAEEQRVVTLVEPRIEDGKIVWAEIIDLTEDDKAMRLADRRRAAEQRRTYLFQQLSWRYERYQRETRMGITPKDDIAALDQYAQALADLPQQPGWPRTITWPTSPMPNSTND